MRKTAKINKTRNKGDIPKKYVRKPKVEFSFISMGRTFKNGTGRIKISTDGGVSMLTKVNGKWIPTKGILKTIKLKK